MPSPMEQMLMALMAQAQQRPDLAQTQPLATFAGRVAQPGQDLAQLMAQMPMGSGEGDPAMATLQASMQPLLKALSASAVAKGAPMLAGSILGGARAPGGPANVNMGGNTIPTDPWFWERPATQSRGPSSGAANVQNINQGMLQRAPQNPRDVPPVNPQDYSKLPRGGRSQGNTQADLQRKAQGEQLEPTASLPASGNPNAMGLYALWQELSRALGIPTAEGVGGFKLK